MSQETPFEQCLRRKPSILLALDIMFAICSAHVTLWETCTQRSRALVTIFKLDSFRVYDLYRLRRLRVIRRFSHLIGWNISSLFEAQTERESKSCWNWLASQMFLMVWKHFVSSANIAILEKETLSGRSFIYKINRIGLSPEERQNKHPPMG
jgi:hypothetical protein